MHISVYIHVYLFTCVCNQYVIYLEVPYIYIDIEALTTPFGCRSKPSPLVKRAG